MDLWNSIVKWFDSTQLQRQIADVDYVGLFSNPWFIVPFGALLLWFIYKQKWRDLIILAIFVAVWWVSGTPYMQSLIVGGEIRIEKLRARLVDDRRRPWAIIRGYTRNIRPADPGSPRTTAPPTRAGDQNRKNE